MLAAIEKDNIATVYYDLAKAEAEIRRRDEQQGPFSAEIVPETEPLWHVLLTAPSHEAIATAHLVGRGFGAYLPTFSREIPARAGRAAHRVTRPLFPGYVFLFVWDIAKHWRRIVACPGISSVLMMDGVSPAVVPDEVIDQIQAVEFKELGKSLVRPRRRWRKKKQIEEEYRASEHIVAIHTRSYWREIKSLDDQARIDLLRHALGL